jgi:hypothetical protein
MREKGSRTSCYDIVCMISSLRKLDAHRIFALFVIFFLGLHIMWDKADMESGFYDTLRYTRNTL